MKNSTFSAQVANNLLTLLQGYSKTIRLLLVMFLTLTVTTNAWAETYKLTKVTSVSAGEKYVFEQGGYVMNNSVSSSALQCTNSYKTTGLEGTEAYVWTLESATGGFYMKNVSKSSSQYLNNSSSTSVSFGTKSSIWKFTFTDGIAVIQNTSNSDRFLGWTSASSHAYKAYATSNMSSSSYPHDITVYKLEEETSTPGGDTGDGDDSGDTNCLTLSATSNYPFNSTSSNNTSVYSTSIDGITFENKGGYKYNSYLSFNRSLSGAYIANTTPFNGNIESIVVDYISGGSSYFNMYEGSASKPSSTVVSPSTTGTGSITYTFSGNNPYFNLALKTTGTYCNINSITICYSNTPAPSHTVTATSNNNSYGTVSVSGTTITATPNDGYRVKSGDAGYTVTSGTAVVTNNGNNTFSVTPSSDCTITINFEAIPKYTVTLIPGSGSVTSTTLTETSAGAGVTLPTPTLDCGDWEFAGWKTTSAVTTETTTKPTLIAAGVYSPTSDITLYAVYKRTETTSGDGGGNTSVTFTDEDSGGWTTTAGEQNGTKDGVSISTTNGIYSQNNNQLRVYKDATFTVSSENIITSIVFSSSNYDWSDTSEGNYSSKTWTGNTKSVTFTAGSGQVRITQIVVTVSAGGTITTTYYHSTPDCGGVDPEPTGYTITFEANGGNKIDKIENATTLPTPLPTTTRAHYTFVGWFTDEGCTQAATAGATINANTTLYAKWNKTAGMITYVTNGGTIVGEYEQLKADGVAVEGGY